MDFQSIVVEFIEEWGTGTNRIIKQCLKHGLPEPLFENITESLVITFRKYRILEEDAEKLNERQKMAVDYIKEKGKITRLEYSKITNISIRMANIDIKDMEVKGFIKRQDKGRSTYYVFK